MRNTIPIIISLAASLSTEVAAAPYQDWPFLPNDGRTRDRPSTMPISRIENAGTPKNRPSGSIVTFPGHPDKEPTFDVRKPDRPQVGGSPNRGGPSTPQHIDVLNQERAHNLQPVNPFDRHFRSGPNSPFLPGGSAHLPGGASPPHGVPPPWAHPPPPPSISVTPSPSSDEPVGIPIDAYVGGIATQGPVIENGRVIQERDLSTTQDGHLGLLGEKIKGVVDNVIADLKDKIEDLLSKAKLNDIIAHITNIIADAKSGDIMSKIPDLVSTIKDMFSSDKAEEIKANVADVLSKHKITEVKAWVENMREKVESRNSELVEHLQDTVSNLREGLGGLIGGGNSKEKRDLVSRMVDLPDLSKEDIEELRKKFLGRHGTHSKPSTQTSKTVPSPKPSGTPKAPFAEAVEKRANLPEHKANIVWSPFPFDDLVNSKRSDSPKGSDKSKGPNDRLLDELRKITLPPIDLAPDFTTHPIAPHQFEPSEALGHFSDVVGSFRDRFKSNPIAETEKLKQKAADMMETFDSIKSSLEKKLSSASERSSSSAEDKIASKIQTGIEHITSTVKTFNEKLHALAKSKGVDKVLADMKPKLKAKAGEAVKYVVTKTIESVKAHLPQVKGEMGEDVKKFLQEHAEDAMRVIAEIADRDNASEER